MSKPHPDSPASLPAANARSRRLPLIAKGSLRRIGVLLGVIGVVLLVCYRVMIAMPGTSHSGPLASLTTSQKTTSEDLQQHVETLAGSIGQRSTFQPKQFAQAAEYIWQQLELSGYTVREHSRVQRGTTVPNLDVEVKGTSLAGEIVLVGAHFDTFQGTPGADDNASGVAATLELARRLASTPHKRTIRFAFFVNEEPPAFWTQDMGSLVYAKKCRADGDVIVAMLSLECIGYYNTQPNSQKYPAPLSLLYPNTGDFLAFVGNVDNRALVRKSINLWRQSTPFPSEGAALPGSLPGIGWSDHWSFWQAGYPAIMLTGTANFRNPNYHTATDTPDSLDYERMARVVDGIEVVMSGLANE